MVVSSQGSAAGATLGYETEPRLGFVSVSMRDSLNQVPLSPDLFFAMASRDDAFVAAAELSSPLVFEFVGDGGCAVADV